MSVSWLTNSKGADCFSVVAAPVDSDEGDCDEEEEGEEEEEEEAE